MNLFENLQKLNEEFFDGYKTYDAYYEIFKNPTSKEIQIVKDSNFYKSIRGIIHDNDWYIWPGNTLHHDLAHKLQNSNNQIDIDSGLRFAYKPSEGWHFNSAGVTIDCIEYCQLIISKIDILKQVGNLKDTIELLFWKDNSADKLYFENGLDGIIVFLYKEGKITKEQGKQLLIK